MSRTLVYAVTKAAAERWCRENDVAPHARSTYIIAGKHGGRGFQINPDDRIVFVGEVLMRLDFRDVVLSLLPALTGPNVIEWHVPGPRPG